MSRTTGSRATPAPSISRSGAPARSSLVWEVERGEGQFAGAAGLIASHLVVGDAGEVVDTQIGVIALASPRGRRGPGGAA